MDATFFTSPDELHAWFMEHHDTEKELLIGFYKKGAETPGITYAEALDEALCFGWIDGIRKRIDDRRFTIRFTPRKPRSIWSAVNIKRAGELVAEGRMQPAGHKEFTERDRTREKQYSFEQESHTFDPAYEERFRANAAAWAFFAAQAPSYQRTAIWWVMSAKKEETRLRRLATLVEDSAAGRRLAHLTRVAKAPG
jgi:uncharacterized protein YdeI (YjbR/CyaY-like superfamily)